MTRDGTRRLGRGELIAGSCALALAVDEFLPWYGKGGFHRTAWEAFSFVDILMLVTALTAAGLAVVVFGRRSVALAMAASVVLSALSIVCTLVVAGRLLAGPPEPSHLSTQVWAFAGLLLSAGVAAGALDALRDERVDWPGAAHESAAVPRRPAPTIGP